MISPHLSRELVFIINKSRKDDNTYFNDKLMNGNGRILLI